MAGYTFRRRVRWAVGAALLCAAALPCLIGGLAYQTSAAGTWRALNEMAPAMLACLDRVRDELAALDAGDKAASFSRLDAWVTECDEEVQRVNEKLRHRPESTLARKRMNEEWAAVVRRSRMLAAAGRSSDRGDTPVMLHQLQVDFDFFEKSYRDSVAAALSTTSYKHRMGGYLLYAGCVAVAAAGLACCVFVASTLLVGDSEYFDPARLRDELKRIAATERFIARINLLRRDAPGPAPGAGDFVAVFDGTFANLMFSSALPACQVTGVCEAKGGLAVVCRSTGLGEDNQCPPTIAPAQGRYGGGRYDGYVMLIEKP